jgi:hypothetical protein
MIIEESNFRVAVGVVAEDAVFESRGVATGEVSVHGAPCGGVKRLVVEVHRRVGGLPQRALVGGTMTSAGCDKFKVEVGLSGPISLGEAPSCEGSFGRALVPGLPDEFGDAVVAGLLREAGRGGTLVVDRAAYDPVESSSTAFGVASALLAFVLNLERVEDAEMPVRGKLKEFV